MTLWKGRRRGERNPNAKLTWMAVKLIRLLYRHNEFSSYVLADIFKVTQGNIWHIISKKSWTLPTSKGGL